MSIVYLYYKRSLSYFVYRIKPAIFLQTYDSKRQRMITSVSTEKKNEENVDFDGSVIVK